MLAPPNVIRPCDGVHPHGLDPCVCHLNQIREKERDKPHPLVDEDKRFDLL